MQPTHIYLGSLVIATAVALLGWLVSRGCVLQRERWSWRLIAASQAAAALSSGLRACILAGVAEGMPLPALVEPAWLAQYPLLSLGLVLQCHGAQQGRAWIARFVDVSVFLLGAVWLMTMSPVGSAAAAGGANVSTILSLTRPLWNVVLAAALLYMLLGREQLQLPLADLYLAAAVSLRVLAGGLEAMALAPAPPSQDASLLLLIWIVAWLALGLVAADRLAAQDVARSASGLGPTVEAHWLLLVRSAFAYLPLPAALLLWVVRGQEKAPFLDASLLPALLTVVLLLLSLRLLLIAWESYRQGRFASNLSQQLQTRVVQQALQTVSHSHDLGILTTVATQLADCTSAEDTLSRGLELASEALQFSAGVVWTRADDGRMDLAAHRGLQPNAEGSLADLPNKAPTLSQALLASGPTVVRDPDFLSHPRIAGAFTHSPSGLLIVPLLSRRTVVGALGLVTNDCAALSGSRLQLAEVIGAQLAVALDNARRYEGVRSMADRDQMTGLFNHRAIHEQLERELGRTRRASSQLAVVVGDIDSFKLFNDTYGHLAGDRVLQTVASVMLRTARSSDIMGRQGGDEFLGILPDTGVDGAMSFVRRLRADLDGHAYVADDRRIPISMSLGMAAYPDNGSTVQELLRSADANMYRSKRAGDDLLSVPQNFDPLSPRQGEVFGVLDGLVTAIDGKDHYTRKHSEDVTAYSLAISKLLQLPQSGLRTIRVAGLLHDVGKIGVPTDLLRKPARFAEEERSIMKQHVQLGEMIISGVPNVAEIRSAVAAHHERIDGRGYPRHLEKDDIPLTGRILAVADTFSAMTSSRPYRQAMDPDEAKKELRRVSGSQLDPALVELFIEALEKGVAPLRLDPR